MRSQELSTTQRGRGLTTYGGYGGGSGDPVQQLFNQMEQLLSSVVGSSVIGSRRAGGRGYGGVGSQNIADVLVDVIDQPEQYQILAELPGCNQNDIKVTVEGDNMLVIRGQRTQTQTQQQNQQTQQQQGATLLIVERDQGQQYLRSLHLPEHVDRDQIKANFNNGLLEIIVPKSRDHQQSRKEIQITGGTSGSGSGSGSR